MAVHLSDPLEPTIFHERWWLDIATSGTCQFVEVCQNGHAVGRLPYLVKRAFGMRMVEMPQMTHFLGPAILDGEGKPHNRFLRRLDITRELIEKLPQVERIYIKCHVDVADVISFQSCGFRTAVQFTNEIKPQPIDALWGSMRDKGRNGIRQARHQVTVETNLDLDEFFDAYDRHLRARGLVNHMRFDIVGRLITGAIDRSRGALIGARNKSGALVAAIFYAWDKRAAYYLLSTRDSMSHRGAISLLLWHAISDTMARGLTFDFDGLADEGGARLAANFTSDIVPRYVVIKESHTMRILFALRSVWQTESHFSQ